MNGSSWKTTLGGIGALLTALSMIVAILTGNAELNATNIGVIATGFTAAWGLFHAKDNNVTGAGSTATTVTKN